MNVTDNDDCTVAMCAAFVGEPELGEWLWYRGAYKNRDALGPKGLEALAAAQQGHTDDNAEETGELGTETQVMGEPASLSAAQNA